MEIIRAFPEDLDILVMVSRKTFHDAFHHLNLKANMDAYMNMAFTHENLLNELQMQNSEFYLIKDTDNVVGYFKINRKDAQTEFKDDISLEIERIYVDEDHQGKGRGTEIINHIKAIALSTGIRYLWLGVWEKNPAAIRFYERNGFKVFSAHEFQMGDEVQMDKLMICKL
ncbi:MAG TPA: GNAT family N-acetyltransferase [Saprospiraceae bacterium]|nr:GNAT family N-acetyltransferase [Saprospiraceae bacterium]